MPLCNTLENGMSSGQAKETKESRNRICSERSCPLEGMEAKQAAGSVGRKSPTPTPDQQRTNQGCREEGRLPSHRHSEDRLVCRLGPRQGA